jgi:Fe-S cluster assembly protein SufB
LNEDVIRLISAKKKEPAFMLEWRLKAYRGWLKMSEPHWPNVTYPPIDYQSISYYAAPKTQKPLGSLDEVDPKLLETYQSSGSLCRSRRSSPVSRWTRSSIASRSGLRTRRSSPSGHHLLLVR